MAPVQVRAGSVARWEPIWAPEVSGWDRPDGETSSTVATSSVSAVLAVV